MVGIIFPQTRRFCGGGISRRSVSTSFLNWIYIEFYVTISRRLKEASPDQTIHHPGIRYEPSSYSKLFPETVELYMTHKSAIPELASGR